ncbi:Uncharacterized protein TCM_010958 [Theobroma cacao]|uniref:Reverse transcriptase zinc-binding domain-containing protein n=1 Tax=Theobroma cacao TaxID=3641 RepID=A0A061E7S8_THECC|nr:Uncharacterized protein TCM_010958 [Theobroma cacao]
MKVRGELLRRGLINRNVALCSVCNKDIETVDHLFLRCYDSWRVWNLCNDAWAYNWVLLDVVREPFCARARAVLKKEKPKVDWVNPSNECMKFNLDKVARGCSRAVRIGGVLRDNNGTHEIIVESDSINAVKWWNDSSFALWQMRINQLADRLTKERVDCSVDLVQIFNQVCFLLLFYFP